MKKAMMVLMATVMFAATMPAYAMDHDGSRHDPESIQCQKECDMLLKDCAKEVDSIQQQIKKLRVAIKKDGADQAKLDEIKALKQKLSDAKETLKTLSKPGK
jgi:peptidoglycan hydrolase CwlO-like protein